MIVTDIEDNRKPLDINAIIDNFRNKITFMLC